MRLEALKFPGYRAGETDFDSVESRAPADERAKLQRLLDRLSEDVLNPANGRTTSLIIVGHSDRQDTAAMSCDQRRKSEADAARDRATSAWEWTKVQVNGRLVVAGRPLDEWWDASSSMTWGLVYAGAGMLEKEVPGTEEERRLNRRVLFLISAFPPE